MGPSGASSCPQNTKHHEPAPGAGGPRSPTKVKRLFCLSISYRDFASAILEVPLIFRDLGAANPNGANCWSGSNLRSKAAEWLLAAGQK
jgi:hypothetical protein